jgi:acetyl/propionyl-CoA carboxylase alpha subunit
MGGGGKGMLIAHNQTEFIANARQASRESLRYFGDARIYVEKYFDKPRHIEIQLLADQHGNIIHLFERECSIQRRYQKVIEESPAPNLTVSTRKALTDDAIKLATKIGYENAGTIEFLLDEKDQHYFLEMNTRIQVEHPVTEAITGIDLIEEQINIAIGHPLRFNQNAIKINGHAIEARIYAESPENDFAPSPGIITLIELNKDCRIETHIESGNEVFPDYDPLIAKVISHQNSRNLAIHQLKQSLNQSAIIGIETNLHFLSKVLEHPLFGIGNYNTSFCKNHLNQLKFTGLETDFIKYLAPYIALKLSLKGQTQYWRMIKKTKVTWRNSKYTIAYNETSTKLDFEVNNERLSISDILITSNQIEFTNQTITHKYFYVTNNQAIIISIDGINHQFTPSDWLPNFHASKNKEKPENGNILHAPLPGKIVQVNVKPGDTIKKGDLLIVMEAMKMENHLKAWKNGIVDQIMVINGNQVKSNEKLLTIY